MTPLREVLLIDDSDADNYLHRRVILRSGLAKTVTVKKNAVDGLAYLKQVASPPDILFLDINMPGMNGWEFLDQLEALPAEKHSPVFIAMLSTSVNPADHERAVSHNHVQGFFSKPLTEEALVHIIRQCTENC